MGWGEPQGGRCCVGPDQVVLDLDDVVALFHVVDQDVDDVPPTMAAVHAAEQVRFLVDDALRRAGRQERVS